MSALQYWWLIWLEWVLPARPRHRVVPYQREEKVEESEDREEEVVERWIAQGRARRASLDWCNTFLKRMLELTVGRFWYHAVEHVVRVLLKLQSSKTVLEGLISHLTYRFIGLYFSVHPLAHLVAFIVIPAHKQIVFIAGAELGMIIFLTTLVRAFATWAVKTDFAQTMMRSIADSVGKTGGNQKNVASPQRYKKEL